ncbi:actin-like ATPase domain-containing protein [Rhizophagus irregularis]|uniref:Actin-like ATPase domain-containing protein n=1 Tax=Rhizophagus irregularis TaxID=588596 RepID=A0A2N0RY51_9GLOM|nr:actin-like ATPase domain-containing protein [Rhizophagus irregularis]CAB4375399.1 unnamed protein product [Rhizophagus irregularis]
MSKKLKKFEDIRVVVGLDFGTTFSGFTYCHVEDRQNMSTNETWPGQLGQFKTNTVLEYDDDLDKVVLWGYPALTKRPSRNKEKNKRKNVVELFKLHLGNLSPKLRNELSVDYKKAITDYLGEIGKCVEETIDVRWKGMKLENVLFILTVPAEYDDKAIRIMRECMSDAKLIDDLYSERLQFTTEPEAAAIYCMENNLKEHDLTDSGTTFMIVDCGGGTVDLTTRKLLNRKQLGEVTERTGDYCGSTFIDKEFKNYLRRRLGKETIDSFEKEQYGQLQFMVQEFCENAKLPFTGDDTNFNYEMDLEDIPVLLEDYLNDDVKERLEKDENLIKFDYETIKSMFDPIVEKIIKMIRMQLDNSREKSSKPSIMFLVGGFSESKYLQKRIKDAFRDHVDNISVPQSPTAAISRGAAMYGLSLYNGEDPSIRKGSKSVIGSRVLKNTYGVDVLRPWSPGDPKERVGLSFFGPSTLYFNIIAKRGTVAKIDDVFPTEGLTVSPGNPFQTVGEFDIYYTSEYDAEFSNESGMKLLGKLKFDWDDVHLGFDRSVTFKLSFCEMEITAIATNDLTGQNYHTYFEINTEK